MCVCVYVCSFVSCVYVCMRGIVCVRVFMVVYVLQFWIVSGFVFVFVIVSVHMFVCVFVLVFEFGYVVLCSESLCLYLCL